MKMAETSIRRGKGSKRGSYMMVNFGFLTAIAGASPAMHNFVNATPNKLFHDKFLHGMYTRV